MISMILMALMCGRTVFNVIMCLRARMKILEKVMDAMGLGSGEKKNEKGSASDGADRTKISVNEVHGFELTYARWTCIFT
jgi:hypothetical protein